MGTRMRPGPTGISEGRVDTFTNRLPQAGYAQTRADQSQFEKITGGQGQGGGLQSAAKVALEKLSKTPAVEEAKAAQVSESKATGVPAKAKEFEKKSAESGAELKEQGKKTKDELNAIGGRAKEELDRLGMDYRLQAEKLASGQEQEAAKAYGRMNEGLSKMDTLSKEIEKLKNEGAINSPVVQRQIAAMNSVLDKQKTEGADDIRRQMAQHGFVSSGEEIGLVANYERDIEIAKAVGAVDIEQKQIATLNAQIGMQAGLAQFETDLFAKQFGQFSTEAIGLRKDALAGEAGFREKGISTEQAFGLAGTAAEGEFFRMGEMTELAGTEKSLESLLQMEGIKSGERIAEANREMDRESRDAQASSSFWEGIFTLAGTAGGFVLGGPVGAAGGSAAGQAAGKIATNA